MQIHRLHVRAEAPSPSKEAGLTLLPGDVRCCLRLRKASGLKGRATE